MTWHSATVTTQRLSALVGKIRSAGGTVTNCRPEADGVLVTWTTPPNPR